VMTRMSIAASIFWSHQPLAVGVQHNRLSRGLF
jgi:hypothetical protein